MRPLFRPGLQGGGRYRLVLVIRVAILAVLLLVTFIFHVSGTALVEMKIARLGVFIALVVGVGWVSRRRKRLNSTTTPPDDGASRPAGDPATGRGQRQRAADRQLDGWRLHS